MQGGWHVVWMLGLMQWMTNSHESSRDSLHENEAIATWCFPSDCDEMFMPICLLQHGTPVLCPGLTLHSAWLDILTCPLAFPLLNIFILQPFSYIFSFLLHTCILITDWMHAHVHECVQCSISNRWCDKYLKCVGYTAKNIIFTMSGVLTLPVYSWYWGHVYAVCRGLQSSGCCNKISTCGE